MKLLLVRRNYGEEACGLVSFQDEKWHLDFFSIWGHKNCVTDKNVDN